MPFEVLMLVNAMKDRCDIPNAQFEQCAEGSGQAMYTSVGRDCTRPLVHSFCRCPGLQSAISSNYSAGSRYNIVQNAHEFAGEHEIRDLEPIIALLNLRHGLTASLIHTVINGQIGERGARCPSP